MTWTLQEHNILSAPVNIEQEDTQSFINDYYLTHDEVNRFEHKVSGNGATNNGSEVHKPLDILITYLHLFQFTGGDPADGTDEHSVCTDRWHNMSPEGMKWMWGIF